MFDLSTFLSGKSSRVLQKETCLELQKSQFVRLVDILVIGPLMFYAAYKVKDTWLKIILIIVAVATIVYNAKNYYANLQRQKQNLSS